jgi:DNA-binding helix-hairpin-helix protein with protein kinase domain
MTIITTHDGIELSLGPEYKRGGEGIVYHVTQDFFPFAMVAKIYHPKLRDNSRRSKLQIMIGHPPKQQDTHIAVAWPIHILYVNNEFCGYTMPYIHDAIIIHHLMNFPTIRRYSHQFMYGVSMNVAHCVYAIHQAGHVIGDINERNFLVNRNALVTLVDSDSIQISDGHHVLRCDVCVPEYTPAELHGVDLSVTNRSVNHDYFGLAVILFQLLVGRHPFAGRPINTQIVSERVDLFCIRNNIFPYITNPSFIPPPCMPDLYHLPTSLQDFFIRAFTTLDRPTAKDWVSALSQASRTLTQCGNGHYHPIGCVCMICYIEDRLY